MGPSAAAASNLIDYSAQSMLMQKECSQHTSDRQNRQTQRNQQTGGKTTVIGTFRERSEVRRRTSATWMDEDIIISITISITTTLHSEHTNQIEAV